MAVKLVVFDIAGTTVKDNHDVSRALSLALKTFGYHVAVAEIDPIMGYEKTSAIRHLLDRHQSSAANISDQLVSDIHQEFVEQMMKHYQTSPDVVPLPNVEETFRALQNQGIQVGINTGFSKDIAETIINRLQWREKGLINHLVGSDEVPMGRPHPYMIQKMMQDGGIAQPSEVAKIGDTKVDIEEGINAGCRYVVGITTGTFTRQQLLTYQPTHVIDDIAHIINIINQ